MSRVVRRVLPKPKAPAPAPVLAPPAPEPVAAPVQEPTTDVAAEKKRQKRGRASTVVASNAFLGANGDDVLGG